MIERSVVQCLCAIFLLSNCYGLPTPSTYDTIVVGLGASGTAAASTLAKAGRKVLALEAQNRIGGRVNTVSFGDDIVELGAEWIHGNDSSPTYELAIKNNVSVLVQDSNLHAYFSDGSTDKEYIVIDLAGFILQVESDPKFLANQEPKDPQPLGQYLSKRVREYIKIKHPTVQNDTDFIEGCLEFLDIFINSYESSNSWNDVSTWSNFHALGGNQDISWHTYGYKTLFDILLNKYNSGPGYPTLEVRLNTEVTNIQWPEKPEEYVVVTVKDGSVYTAKNVIVTVSIGVLKERYETLFSPPLPETKISPIKALSIGLCDKVIFRFDHGWWPANSYNAFVWRDADKASVSEEDQWLLRVNTAGQPMASNNSLTLWVCGNAAKTMESLPEDVVKTKIMGLIRKFMGADRTIPEPIEMKRSAWFSNAFIRGSYSYDNIDTHKYPTARADLARPLVDSSGVPRVLFAGEASDSFHFSTVHGAIETGRREANRLLAA